MGEWFKDLGCLLKKFFPAARELLKRYFGTRSKNEKKGYNYVGTSTVLA
jgi:hypothetical protein